MKTIFPFVYNSSLWSYNVAIASFFTLGWYEGSGKVKLLSYSIKLQCAAGANMHDTKLKGACNSYSTKKFYIVYIVQ